MQRLKRFSPFDGDLYLQNHPDLEHSGLDPYVHFLSNGYRELRIHDQSQIARAVARTIHMPYSVSTLTSSGLSAKRVQVLCSSRGNEFMRSLGQHLVNGLKRCGAEAYLHDDEMHSDDEPDFRIILAPHEFFYGGRGTRWLDSKILSRTVMFSTEQIQTQWYWNSLPFLLMSRGVIDMFPHTAMLLAEAGVPSVYFSPEPGPRESPIPIERISHHPLFSSLPEEAQRPGYPTSPLEDRPIDVSFFGTSSKHRDRVLARMTPFLASFENFIYYRQIDRGPLEREDSLLSPLAEHVSGHSRICLNIHRDRFPSFEWQRIVELGMCSGAVVVSDPCQTVTGIIPGEHYLEADSMNMGEMIEWLLRDREGQMLCAQIRHNASRLLADAHRANASAIHVADFLMNLP